MPRMVFELRQAGQTGATRDHQRASYAPGPPMWLSVALARTISLAFLGLVILAVSQWL
jgi:hypothetical protein